MKKILFLVCSIILLLVFSNAAFSEDAEEAAVPEEEEVIDATIEIGEGSLTLGAYLDLLEYQSMSEDGGSADFGLYMFQISASGQYGMLSFGASYNFTQPGFAFGDYPTNHWLEEGYITLTLPEMSMLSADLTVGKFYVPFGLDGDFTWYFTYPYYMGLMGDPDYGLKLGLGLGSFADLLDVGIQLAYMIVEDNTNGSFNAGLPDVSTEALGNERDVLAAKLDVGIAAGALSALISYSMQMGRYVPDDNYGGYTFLTALYGADPGVENTYFLTQAIDLVVDISFGDLSIGVLGEFILFNNDRKDRFADLTAADDPLSGIGFVAGVNIAYSLGKGILDGISAHFDYCMVDRDYGDSADLIVAGIILDHYGLFATTIEFVTGDDGDAAFADNLLLIDFSVGF